MRYMMLVYTKEKEGGLTPEQAEQLTAAHWAVMREATQKGVLGGRVVGPHHKLNHRSCAKRQNR